jgi:transcriptional regulator with XRE-family HTH domain
MPRIQESNHKIEVNLIGSNIRCLRQMRNIKAEDMARQLGLSKASYSDIENDKVRTRLDRIQQIADLLGVHYSQVINFNPNHLLSPPAHAPQPAQGVQADLIASFMRQLAVKDEQINFLQEQLVFYKEMLGAQNRALASTAAALV